MAHVAHGKIGFIVFGHCWRLLSWHGSGQETAAVLLPGFAINWQQNQVTRQPQFRDLTHILFCSQFSATHFMIGNP